MNTKKHLWTWAFSSVLIAGLAQADGVTGGGKAARYVIGFDDDVIEVRRDGRVELIEATRIGSPSQQRPMKILDDDGGGFVKVIGKDGEVWLSQSYLKLNGEETPVCIQADIGRRTDRRLASAHGMAEQGCLLKD